MEAGRTLLSPPPNLPRTHHLRASLSVPLLHDPATRAVTSVPNNSIMRYFHASVLSHEQRDDYKTSCVIKEEKIAQGILDRRQVEGGSPIQEVKEKYELDQSLSYYERQLLYRPRFLYPFPLHYTEENPTVPVYMESILGDKNVVPTFGPTQVEQGISVSIEPEDVLALAKKAMLASQKAASLAENSDILAIDFDESHFLGLRPHGSAKNGQIKEETTVRSKKLLERQSKKRKIPKKPRDFDFEITSSIDEDISKKIDKGLDSSDPLRLFLWGPETKQLLTIKEEKDLFVQIQDVKRVEDVKQRLQAQFNREPTLVEWAQAVGMSCHVLQSCLHSGKRSREKVVCANFRLVIHIARQYEGKGLNIQDLLQEGSRGLMKSVDKFKPRVGCRFPTYAYWWIRQSIRKAIFQNSRTIRLPEHVFAALKRIKDAKRFCLKEGHIPTNAELAKHTGIGIQKLESLLSTSRTPISIQDSAWRDQGATYQETTADPGIESPELCIDKKMMRQHVHVLLGVLDPRDRQIIRLRFGIHDNKPKTLTQIGDVLGLTKERVRQLESRALDKLKGCLESHGLGVYVNLLI